MDDEDFLALIALVQAELRIQAQPMSPTVATTV